MRRLLLPALLSVLLLAPAAYADEFVPKPDDQVVFNLAAEDWVTTKTARVTANVEAAVSGSNAGSMRGEMLKAVNALAAGDWRLVTFNRNQDQTGLERWSASFEVRLPESELGGLGENAKKLSKAGMQLSVGDIDFSPTLDEVETARANLRTQIYKKAADQLTALNAALPGRGYRIAALDFVPDDMPPPGFARPMAIMAGRAMAMTAQAPEPPVERSEKLHVTAHVVFASLPPAKAAQ